jgi:hypothetical protein
MRLQLISRAECWGLFSGPRQALPRVTAPARSPRPRREAKAKKGLRVIMADTPCGFAVLLPAPVLAGQTHGGPNLGAERIPVTERRRCRACCWRLVPVPFPTWIGDARAARERGPR